MEQSGTIRSVTLHLYLVLLQTILVALYAFHLRPLSGGGISLGHLLTLMLLTIVLIIPKAQMGASWFIGLLALGNLGVLLGTLPPDMRSGPGMLCAVMLLLAMVSYVSSIAHFATVSALLMGGYGGSRYHAAFFQTDAVFSLLSLLGLTLVFLSKNGLFQAELERVAARQHHSHRASMMDSLTGLLNRARFLEDVSRVVKYAQHNRNFHYAVLFIDLDGFKPINDRLGHKAGDAVLRHAANLFQQCLRKGDVAGRYGGDEFTLLLNNVQGPADAIRVAERILTKIQAPIDVGQSVKVGASIGIAMSTHIHERAEDLIRDADSAMYRAKAQGKNCYVVSDQAIDVPKSELKARLKALAHSRL